MVVIEAGGSERERLLAATLVRLLAATLVNGGMPKPFARELAGNLDSAGLATGLEQYVEGAAVFLSRRGIMPHGDASMSIVSDFLRWRKGGGRIEDVERREENINGGISWRPSENESVNIALKSFFSHALKEFSEDSHYADGSHSELGSWMTPPSAVASHYKADGIRYATNQELSRLLLRFGRSDDAVRGLDREDRTFVAGVVRDLPHIVTELDVRRYVRMLENPEGGLSVRTAFPVRFVILPEISGRAGETNYTIALVPESARVSRRLQRTRYSGEKGKTDGLGHKYNFVPGALGRNMVSVYGGIGVEHEMQSDHDPGETRGLNIEDWPALLRAAVHADYASLGVEYSLVPKASFKLAWVVCPPEQIPGVAEKLERAYGTDDRPPEGYRTLESVKPPAGYRSWSETEPFRVGEETRGEPKDYFVRRL